MDANEPVRDRAARVLDELGNMDRDVRCLVANAVNDVALRTGPVLARDPRGTSPPGIAFRPESGRAATNTKSR